MVLHRLALAVFSTSVLAAACNIPTYADSDMTKGHEMMSAWANKLGLSDQQKEQVKSICEESKKKADPVEEKLWKEIHEEFAEMKNVLTEDQRQKLPTAIKTVRSKECQEIENKLGLNEDQKQKIARIRNEYEPKFYDVAQESTEAARKKMHELKSEFFSEIRQVLNQDQKAKLVGVLREEFHQWRNPEVRHERLMEVADQLGVNADEKAQLEKIHAKYQPKVQELFTQLKDVCQQERTSIEKILTDQQRMKAQEMWKDLGTSSSSKKDR